MMLPGKVLCLFDLLKMVITGIRHLWGLCQGILKVNSRLQVRDDFLYCRVVRLIPRYWQSILVSKRSRGDAAEGVEEVFAASQPGRQCCVSDGTV